MCYPTIGVDCCSYDKSVGTCQQNAASLGTGSSKINTAQHTETISFPLYATPNEIMILVQAPHAASFKLNSFLAYLSKMNMVVTCSTKTSGDFRRALWRHIPEESPLHYNDISLLRCSDFLSQFFFR
jgi:hypothetical protein